MPKTTIEPMYATVGDSVPAGDWTFEPKFDGMRVLAFVSGRTVRLITRNGKEKQAGFPEIVEALRALAASAGGPLVIDGEVVALEGDTAGQFQTLQQRMHVRDGGRVAALAAEHPAALFAFDLLLDAGGGLLDAPWVERRERLEALLGTPGRRSPLRLAESTPDAARILAQAQRNGWEGVIAKRTDARYVPGARSRDWLKLKLQYRAEFVVGGYTEPRRSREHIGALLLGYYADDGSFVYAGHTGGGFDRAGLKAMHGRLARLARARSPFADPPRTNEPAHWVKPDIVVEVKFAEWTTDDRLRQPIYLGTRDDKPARQVRREANSMQEWGMATVKAEATKKSSARPAKPPARRTLPAGDVVQQLTAIERDGGDGELRFGRGQSLHVSSLGKVYFPDAGVTKGDVMRYYASVAPVMLPHLRDRPIALTRFPDGITGHTFYQQKAPDGVPDTVRVERVTIEHGREEADRIVGCDLPTLLYLVQMGTIVVHTWFSRIDTLDSPDFSLIDLDPGEGVPFAEVVRMARTVRAVTDKLGLESAVKTSGSRGIHIAIPLPRMSDYAMSNAVAERVADEVVRMMPEVATLERRIAKRPRGTILVDINQNARGKHMVAPYSLRAKPTATASAPLRWTEVGSRLKMERFTVRSMPRRIVDRGDLWGEGLRSRNTARAVAAALRTG